MRRLWFASWMVLFLAVPARAQPADSEPVAAELAKIGRTLDRLVRLLESAEVRHEADLLLRRIELMERRIAPFEGRLSEARSEVQGLETEMRRMRSMLEELDEMIDDAIRDGTDRADSDERETQAQVRAELRRLGEQLEIAELRKRQAEDALADAREEIEILDDALIELLERRGTAAPARD